MLNNENIRVIVRSYLHEACQHLGIDDTAVPVKFMAMPVTTTLILLLKEADVVVIDTNLLSKFISASSFTPIRMEIYEIARDIFNRKKAKEHGASFTERDLFVDRMSFAYTLGMLKGLRLPVPPIPEKDDILNCIVQIVNDEFHEDCMLGSVPSRSVPGEKDYFLKKQAKALNDARLSLSMGTSVLYAKDIATGIGTEECPFNDIEEATEFVLSEEKKAYDSDRYMQDVLLQRRFNFLPDKNIYNIPWADGNASWIHPELPGDSFLVNHLLSGRFSLKPNLFGRKFLYRGQNEYYARCTPGLFRDDRKKFFLDDMIMCQELQLVCASHPLVKLLGNGIELWHDMFRFEMNYYGLAQHYYNRTGFLDMTSDIETAKFFAVTDYNRETDTYSPHVKTDKLGVLYYYELSMPGAFSYNQDKMLSVIGKQVFMRSGQQHGFLLNMEKGTNFNDFPEVHKVFFRHNEDVSKRIFESSDMGNKYFPNDGLQEMWKRRNIHLVSADAVKLNVKRNPGETFKSIERKLAKYNIAVNNYSPSFDEDLLEMYYQDIRNGWWQDVFCKDIYFCSDDGVIYKDLLLNIPNREEYKWAFEKKL